MKTAEAEIREKILAKISSIEFRSVSDEKGYHSRLASSLTSLFAQQLTDSKQIESKAIQLVVKYKEQLAEREKEKGVFAVDLDWEVRYDEKDLANIMKPDECRFIGNQLECLQFIIKNKPQLNGRDLPSVDEIDWNDVQSKLNDKFDNIRMGADHVWWLMKKYSPKYVSGKYDKIGDEYHLKPQANSYSEEDVKNLAEKNMRELARYGGMIKIEPKSDMIPTDSQRVEKPTNTEREVKYGSGYCPRCLNITNECDCKLL